MDDNKQHNKVDIDAEKQSDNVDDKEQVGVREFVRFVIHGLSIIATIVFVLLTINYWIKAGSFNDAPYATGPYGSNVVRPTNPYRIYVFIFAPLSFLACCLAAGSSK